MAKDKDKVLCPRCGQPSEENGGIFYEKGEWDGKSYDEEANVDEYRCPGCRTRFAILEDRPL
jgi:hypothetical protein